MAGSNPDFNAAEFRANIHAAMDMGAALESAEQVMFHFPGTLVYNRPTDETNTPFDPAATVTSTPGSTKQVPCAVEYFDSENQPTTFGLLAPARIEVTLLDEDYEQVKNASYVVVHGDRYNYRRTEPPSGLFDVGLYVMHFTALNEGRP